jgi:hypothetical protein
LLALKLILVPGFLGLISLAGRRWGPGVAGWLASFPVVAGPILLFLAMEHGTGFAAQAASASLAAVFASTSFSVVYARVCGRFGWIGSLLAGYAAWLACVLMLAQLPVSPWIALAVALATLVIAPYLFPAPREGTATSALPRQELLLRMAAGAALVLLVTAAAAHIGAGWSGLLAVFPILSSVLAVFSHTSNGSWFAARLLQAMVSGLYSFAAFCFVLALALPGYGVAMSFSAAVLVAAAVQWPMMKSLLR